MEALQPLNDALKRRGIRGRIVAVKDRLFLRGTFATVDSARKDRRIALGLPAQQGQLLEAENRVVALAAIIATTGIVPAELPWDAPAPVSPRATLGQITVADAVSQLECDFWQGKVRTSAAERTWDRLKAEKYLLPQAATLTMDLLVATANNTEDGSRTRLESCKVLKRLAKLVGITGTDRLDALRTPYEPEVRDVPGSDAVAALVEQVIDHPTWGWCTWALATYGCRPAEVFSLRPADDGTAQVLTVKRKGKLPTWQTALALRLSQSAGGRVVPWGPTGALGRDRSSEIRQRHRQDLLRSVGGVVAAAAPDDPAV